MPNICPRCHRPLQSHSKLLSCEHCHRFFLLLGERLVEGMLSPDWQTRAPMELGLWLLAAA